MENKMEEMIKEQLEQEGYDYAVAIATKAEIEAGAACGQLSIIDDEE
jgi:adenine C2-methylase RlmN of 23S rRNA A2503 and tRNA A37